MTSIISSYKGIVNTIPFEAVRDFSYIVVNNKQIMLSKNSNKYNRIKFRNHIMDHIHDIMINENYKLRRIRNIKRIVTSWDIHPSWNKLKVETISLEDEFLKKHFNPSILKYYHKLNDVYKKKFYCWCYIYINSGFYVGNSFLRLNYPLEYFIKKLNIIVVNTLTNTIYDDFFYFSHYNKFLFAIINTVTLFVNNNKYTTSYNLLFGDTLFNEIYKSRQDFSENTQVLKLDSFIKNDSDKNCNYCWLNNTNNTYERYIDIPVKNCREIEKINDSNWRLKKIFNISL